jgi:5-methylcytosine-specific restriction endonuclease McrA
MPKGKFKNPKERSKKISNKLKLGSNFNCIICDSLLWRKPCEIKKGNNKFCSKECYFQWQKGKKKIVRNHYDKRGKNNPNWKNGIDPINKRIRASDEYKIWRLSVFERDRFICQDCGVCGVFLHAHHKKPFATNPKLRFDINNGETLCKKCHARKPKGKEILSGPKTILTK